MFDALEAAALIALAGAPTPEETAPSSLCAESEYTVLAGQVEDDFGFDLAVCVSGEAEDKSLAIRWKGEGGGSSVSCVMRKCDGRIQYSRYTSPTLTILTLAWREGGAGSRDGGTQRLTQTLSRADLVQPAQTETRHSWLPAGAQRDEALDCPVVTTAEPLALMELEGLLENKPWTTPLLAGAEQ